MARDGSTVLLTGASSDLLAGVVESSRRRMPYPSPTSSRVPVGTVAGVPARPADALQLRAAVLRG